MAQPASDRSRVLVIDDEEVMQDILARLLSGAGFEVVAALTPEEGLRRVAGEEFELVLLDLMLPGMSGLDVLERIRSGDPELPVILLTAFATVENAIEAMKRGAFDYVMKPFRNDELLMTCRRALAALRLNSENRKLRARLRERHRLDSLVGRSPAMTRLFELILQASPSRSTVLIEGESGTGKELVARSLHAQSPRCEGPFVVVNCGNLSPDMQESLLFGHVKGAFPGANQARKGLVELADGGTLFFDEVASLGLDVQTRLLRVLQEREIMRVGSSEVTRVDARIVAATSDDLPAAVAAGRFREDLYYRLRVIALPLPPLRDRSGDVSLLATHFLELYARENGKKIRSIDARALELLEAHDWPGNVRELENVIQKAVVLCRSDVVTSALLADDLRATVRAPARLRPDPSDAPLKERVEEFERDVIVDALRESNGVQKKAAERLGLKPTTLNEKIKRLGIRYRDGA